MALQIRHPKTDVLPDLPNQDPRTIQPSHFIEVHTVTGTLGLDQGGTGQTTANSALNALLPDQTGQDNKVLTTISGNALWQSAPAPILTGGNGITYTAGTIDADINTTNLKFTSDKINTIQDISTSSSPTFLFITANTVTTNNLYLGGVDQGIPYLVIDAGVIKPVATSSSFTFDYVNFVLKAPAIQLDNLAASRVPYADTNKKLVSNASFTYDATNSILNAPAIQLANLTSGTVPYIDSNKQIVSDSDLTYDANNNNLKITGDGSLYINGTITDPDYMRIHQNAALNIGVIDFSTELWIRPNGGSTMLAMTTAGIRLGGSALDANYILQAPNSASQRFKANGYDTYSNGDIKENIIDMPSVTSKLRLLKPRLFNFKKFWLDDYTEEPASQTQGGFIAQEFSQQFPEYCTFDNGGIARAIDYSRLTADLTKGWQELDARIKVLEGNP